MSGNENGFADGLKRELRMAVGGYCSAPHCGNQTVGFDPSKRQEIHNGEAAHMSGQRGPRVDTLPQGVGLNSFENGIWLCRICHRLVDQIPDLYPRETLERWKAHAIQAHENGYRRMNSYQYGTSIVDELNRARDFIDYLKPVAKAVHDSRWTADPYWKKSSISEEVGYRVRGWYRGTPTRYEWGNRHPHWTFSPDFRNWQDELVRLAEALSYLPQLKILAEDRSVSWITFQYEDGSIGYQDPSAAALICFVSELNRFEEFLNRYRGPSF